MAKYVIDIDALKDCLDLIEGFKMNGRDATFVHNVKLLIDKFPKEPLDCDISKLMIKGETEDGTNA